MSQTATASSPLDGLNIHHNSTVEVEPSHSGWFATVLDGERIVDGLAHDDANSIAADIERQIKVERAIHNAPIRHDSRIESVCTDPDPETHEIRVDGHLIGEWGWETAHDVEVALEERITDARDAIRRAEVVRGLRQLAEFIEQHPDLPAPSWASAMLPTAYAGEGAREALAATAEQLAEYTLSDGLTRDYISIERRFDGGVRLTQEISREEACSPAIVDGKVVWQYPELPGRRHDETKAAA